MFAVTSLPLTDRSDPPSRPLSLTFRKSGALTPGMSVASCMKLRPFSGSSRICCPLMTPDTSPPTVFTGVDSDDADGFGQRTGRQFDVLLAVIGDGEGNAGAGRGLETLQLD